MEKNSDKTESSNTYGLPATVSSFIFNQSWNLYILKIIFRLDWCTALPIVHHFTLIEKSGTKANLNYMATSSILLKIADYMRPEKRMMKKYVLKELECYGNQKKTLFSEIKL